MSQSGARARREQAQEVTHRRHLAFGQYLGPWIDLRQRRILVFLEEAGGTEAPILGRGDALVQPGRLSHPPQRARPPVKVCPALRSSLGQGAATQAIRRVVLEWRPHIRVPDRRGYPPRSLQ